MPKTSKQCQEMREEMKEKILQESMLYFAKNGFSGTKIGELAKYIGIGQGTIYVYFKSKEDLFQEIYKRINTSSDIKELKLLCKLPISAKQKIHKLTESIMEKMTTDKSYAAKVTLNTQVMMGEAAYVSEDTMYPSDLYQYTAQMIKQGQKEGTVVSGDAMKLADYYWGVVYLYALKQLFTTQYEMITVHDLERILLKDEEK